jgi:hypothetical protein
VRLRLFAFFNLLLTLPTTATTTACSTAPLTLLTSPFVDLVIAARPSSNSNLSSDLCFDRISGDEGCCRGGKVEGGLCSKEAGKRSRRRGREGEDEKVESRKERRCLARFSLAQLDDGRFAMRRSSSTVNEDDSLLKQSHTSFLLLESTPPAPS